jgi:adenosine deaminase
LDQWLIRREDDLRLITLEYLQDAARHGVRYAEFFWNPTGTVHYSGLSYAQAQAAIVRGIDDAQKQFGVTGRLIAAIDREASPSQALEMLDWVLSSRVPEMIGLGIDYRENQRPPELFAEAFASARKAGLKLTAHAGEFGLPWHNIATAFDVIGVDRLDHAYTLVDNPELAARVAERGTVITVVPSNSYYRRTLAPERWAQEHPIRRMPSMGLRIHPNTDDPTLHFVTPTDAWAMMVKDFNFGRADLLQFMHNGLDGAWIDDSTRRTMRKDFVSAFEALFPEDLV